VLLTLLALWGLCRDLCHCPSWHTLLLACVGWLHRRLLMGLVT
jgi:hypothetical protein